MVPFHGTAPAALHGLRSGGHETEVRITRERQIARAPVRLPAALVAAIVTLGALGAGPAIGRANGPGQLPTDDLPVADACTLDVDKSVDPVSVTLGGETEVRMRAILDCSAAAAMHAVLLMDSSLDMGGARMGHVRESVDAFAASVDLEASQVALVAYAGVVDVLSPLTSDADVLASGALRLFPRRGSRLAEGLSVASTVLADARAPGDDGPLEAIVVLSGSAPDESDEAVRQAARRAREDGIVVAVVAYGGNAPIALLEDVASSPDLLFVEGLSSRLPSLYASIAPELGTVGVLGAEVTDLLPENMTYVWGSGVPAPRTRGDELSWSYAGWPDGGIAIAYALEPEQTGRHAVSRGASIKVRLDRGEPIVRPFPVPEIDVRPPQTATATVTPTPHPTALPSATRTPVDATPTAQVRLWLPVAARR